ncbi:hypothetical protein [Saliphagus sp. LR7]|uniref:hypothetical protein n=1 Tax=Saliphagus sp. LR7 TaxID=2282654 RepID=UPI000DF83DB8|nr:hypothetical protein [Saliphagus sp. LR7]
MGWLSGLWADVRATPVAAALELGTVFASAGLFLALVVALAWGPPPRGPTALWAAIVAVGAGVAVVWTVLVPVYDRYG